MKRSVLQMLRRSFVKTMRRTLVESFPHYARQQVEELTEILILDEKEFEKHFHRVRMAHRWRRKGAALALTAVMGIVTGYSAAVIWELYPLVRHAQASALGCPYDQRVAFLNLKR